MPRTVFDTPVVSRLLRAASAAFLRLSGWTVTGTLPAEATRSVFIAAPHTSGWDLPYTLMAAFTLRLNIRWMGKSSLFRRPFGPFMRWLGGIAVDRSRSNNLVAASAEAIVRSTVPLQLVVSPEGTRDRARHWKTGFYHIARQAGVPVVLAFMDYERKVCGLGPLLHPSGDLDADMATVKGFYAGVKGKRADRFETG